MILIVIKISDLNQADLNRPTLNIVSIFLEIDKHQNLARLSVLFTCPHKCVTFQEASVNEVMRLRKTESSYSLLVR